MDTHEITKYLDVVQKRKYWIIVPFLTSVLVGLFYGLTAPRVYEASTLIMVETQRVPQEYVRSIVSATIEDRLKTITQQVTSRTNLEAIIKENSLYQKPPERDLVIDEKVEILRKSIKIDVARGGRGGGNAFTISFQDKEADKAMRVTNALASNFISENLKIRESQALGTSSFLADELASVEKRLKEKEEELKQYRERYMGGLPQQLETNLRMIERLQAQLDQLTAHVRDAENRRYLLEKEMADAQRGLTSAPSQAGGTGSEPRDLVSLRAELASLEARYTPNHPDVIRVRTQIAKLEEELSGKSPSAEGPRPVAVSPAHQRLSREIQNVELELARTRAESEKVKSQIRSYQTMVEETPKREQELLSLNRDYDNLKNLYNSLLNRKLEAELAVSMERKQKGEQFRVLDPAKKPFKPVKPDLAKIFLIAAVLGVALGGGLAYLVTIMDTSFKSPEEIEKAFKLPILVSIPFRHTEQELQMRKRREIYKAAGVAVGFAVSAVAIVIGTKGFGATVRYIKELAGL
jgi:polysaccharide chain length determinant protein (PEP-CTERM system associated)